MAQKQPPKDPLTIDEITEEVMRFGSIVFPPSTRRDAYIKSLPKKSRPVALAISKQIDQHMLEYQKAVTQALHTRVERDLAALEKYKQYFDETEFTILRQAVLTVAYGNTQKE